MNKKEKNSQIESRNQSMKDNSEDSRNSKTGYLETGNDAKIQAKARAVRSNSNRTD